MSQSSIIFGSIILAFVVYITRKGELPIYAGLLLLAPGNQQAAQAQQTPNAVVAGVFSSLGL